MNITIGICAEELREIVAAHIKEKGFKVGTENISFVVGKTEEVSGSSKKIKHDLIGCEIEIEV